MEDPAPPPDSPAPDSANPAAPAPFDAFKELAGKLVQVPKKEVDAKEAEYQREQAKKPKRGPKQA